jgi:hypothetical protein
MNVAYIVSSNGGDGFALMTRFSIVSLRYTNPKAQITLLCDSITKKNLDSVRDPILGEVDHVICVSVPDGDPSFRSRYIKTQIGSILEGPFLFLDSDTLVRGNLSEIFNGNYDIAASSNHSRSLFSEQIAEVDLKVLERSHLILNNTTYINSGVLFFRGSSESVNICKKWHHLWKKTWNTTGDHRDQPSLNFVLSTERCNTEILDNRFNAQIKTRLTYKCEEFNNNGRSSLEESAVIWHFYTSLKVSKPLTAYECELRKSLNNQNKINADIVIGLIKRNHPWRRFIWLDDVVALQAGKMPTIMGWRLLWISGRRLAAFRMLACRFKNRLMNLYAKNIN